MQPVEITCLAQTVHGEARGESTRGQEAVAQVILNRLASPRFPKSICGIVKQKHQFSGYHEKSKPTEAIYSLVKRVINTHIPHKYLYFNTSGPKHSARIGNHFFWR